MSRRGRHSAIKLKVSQELLHSLGSLLFFALSGLVILSFSGRGVVLTTTNAYLRTWFGSAALLVPFTLFSAGLMLTHLRWRFAKPHVFLGACILLFSASAFFSSGIVGEFLMTKLADYILPQGAALVWLVSLTAGFLIVSDNSIGDIFHTLADIFEIIPKKQQKEKFEEKFEEDIKKEDKKSLLSGFFQERKINVLDRKDEVSESEDEKKKSIGVAPQRDLGKKIEVLDTEKKSNPREAKVMAKEEVKVWTLPPLTLLDPKSGVAANRGDIKSNADVIEKTLDSFGISARVTEVNGGPAVTQYGIAIGSGTKLSKITALANDLALALAAPTGQIRIEAPIPGKSLVGIEIPNRSPEYVTLRKMLVSDEIKAYKSKLAVSLGLNVAGKPVIVDIAKMPHAIIAGATGSGKSVAINAFIASILFRASPDEVKFIMVDPKRVELTQYNGIPHLLTPVITDSQKVLGTLNWAVGQMNERYKMFAEVGVRNIEGYNEMAGFQSMPYIVIVIDELADIMLLAPAPVEETITRLAQMARAVGIHLILATQRPSVNVITGLIKANVPTRIAFNVSSMIDSRVILDTPGAEKLLGRGDMLYIPPDQAKPTRVQGTYVSDTEISRLIGYIKSQGIDPTYAAEIEEKFQVNSMSNTRSISGGDKDDELVLDAIQVILKQNKASVSILQRYLKLGYGRAARIMDVLASEGIVGEDQGAKGREIHAMRAQEYITHRESENRA